jgi:hypothetical protein
VTFADAFAAFASPRLFFTPFQAHTPQAAVCCSLDTLSTRRCTHSHASQGHTHHAGLLFVVVWSLDHQKASRLRQCVLGKSPSPVCSCNRKRAHAHTHTLVNTAASWRLHMASGVRAKPDERCTSGAARTRVSSQGSSLIPRGWTSDPIASLSVPAS